MENQTRCLYYYIAQSPKMGTEKQVQQDNAKMLVDRSRRRSGQEETTLKKRLQDIDRSLEAWGGGMDLARKVFLIGVIRAMTEL